MDKDESFELISSEEVKRRPTVEFELLEGAKLEERVEVTRKLILELIKKYDDSTDLIQPTKDDELITKRFVTIAKLLKMLELHLEFIKDVLSSSSDDEIPKIKKHYTAIEHHYDHLKSKKDIRMYPINHAIEFILNNILSEVERVTNNFFTIKDSKPFIDKSKYRVIDLHVISQKLDACIEYIPFACVFDKDDIIGHPRESELWTTLYNEADFTEIVPKEKVKKSFETFANLLMVGTAVMSDQEKPENHSIKKFFAPAVNAFTFLTNKEKVNLKAQAHLSDAKMENAFKLWNMLDEKLPKEIMKLGLPFIEYDKKIYIDRLFPAITKESILKEYENGTINKIIPTNFQPPDLASKKEEVLEKLFKSEPNKIQIRILSPKYLKVKNDTSEKFKSFAKGLVSDIRRLPEQPKLKPEEIDEVIFHIHGGGFVSMSSSTHRNHTIRWSNYLGKIIFSVDYRLAPEYPYPAAVDDCWQAYNWVINYSESILGIKIKRLIIAGDSAGGNLSAVITMRAIKEGVRVPDGCFLAYPALSLHPKTYSPSYLVAIDDQLLPYSVLKLCIQAYVPEIYKAEMDPFISPVFAPDEILLKMPPVRLVTGTRDPLHDDNWRMLHRMIKLGKVCKIKVYEDMPHGFYSFDQLEGFEKFIFESCRFLKELFDFHKTKRLTGKQSIQEIDITAMANDDKNNDVSM